MYQAITSFGYIIPNFALTNLIIEGLNQACANLSDLFRVGLLFQTKTINKIFNQYELGNIT